MCGADVAEGGGVEFYSLKDGTIIKILCRQCDVFEKMRLYRDTGEIGTLLLTDAVLCAYYVNEGGGFGRLRPENRAYYEKYKDDLLKIFEDETRIKVEVRRFEVKQWPILRNYYKTSKHRGHSALGDHFKVLLWGCAGRVLVTIQDSDPQNKGRFQGAWITLIFAEDDCGLGQTGGIQGICATSAQAIEMLQLATTELPPFSPDKKVGLAGL